MKIKKIGIYLQKIKIMKKDRYIKKTLKANIELADSKIDELYKECEKYEKLDAKRLLFFQSY